MKSILLSIKPVFVEQIFSGKKIFEFRKRLPLDLDKVIVYETSPTKKIVGEFECKRVIREKKNLLWNLTAFGAGIDKSFFDDYFAKVQEGMAIEIKNPIRYDAPKDLQDIGLTFTPQSWVYIKD